MSHPAEKIYFVAAKKQVLSNSSLVLGPEKITATNAVSYYFR